MRSLHELVDAIRRDLLGLARTEVPGEVVIPLLPGDLPVVHARIDGGPPEEFIVDTAATRTAIRTERAASLGIRPPAAGTPATIATGTGRARLAGFARIATLKIGAAAAFDLEPWVVDFPPPFLDAVERPLAGIIGQDLLRNWVVLFDPLRAELRILRPRGVPERLARLFPHGGGFTRHALSWEGGVPLVRLAVRRTGRSARLIVDTGFDGIALSRALVRALGLAPTGRTEVGGIGGSRWVPTYDLDGIEFCGTTIAAAGAHLHASRSGLLGNAVLRRYAIAIDGPRSRLIGALVT